MSYYPPMSGLDAPSGPAQPSAPLRTAALVLFWLTTAASAATTVAVFARRGVWQDFERGIGSVDDLNDADVPVIIAAFLVTMLLVTSAIAVAFWSMRLIAAAQARNVPELSPGWAVGGWFVPIGFLVLGFRQVTKAVAGVGASTVRVFAWQLAFAAAAIVMTVAQVTSQDIDSPDDVSSSLDSLTRECMLSLASTLLFIAAATAATLALVHADRAVAAVDPA